MNKYGLHGKLQAKKDSGQQLTDILLEAAQLLGSAKGCILYLISNDEQDKEAVWITEVWETKQDHDDSLKLDSVRAVIMKAMPLIDGQPQKGQELLVVGGLGLS